MDDKTKQVQVRLPPDLHRQLKGALALEGKTLVDFFNEAAVTYLKNQNEYCAAITRISGGKDNGKG